MNVKYYNGEQPCVKIEKEGGIPLLESLYNDIRKPLFIDVINNMSTKIGRFKRSEDGVTYFPSDEVCGNILVLATLNIVE